MPNDCEPCVYCGFDGPADAPCPPACPSASGSDPLSIAADKLSGCHARRDHGPGGIFGAASGLVAFTYRGRRSGKYTIKTFRAAKGRPGRDFAGALHFATDADAKQGIEELKALNPGIRRLSY